jgi:hypothetical protein
MAATYEQSHASLPDFIQSVDEYPPIRKNSEKETPEKGSAFVTYTEAHDEKTEVDASQFREVLVNDGNPFPPMPNEIEETSQLTFRAILVGSLLGLIVGASNIYLGLKTGKGYLFIHQISY